MTAKPYGVVYQSHNHYPGSELLFDKWLPGDIHLLNGQVIKNLSINYNAYSDALVYEAEGNTSIEVSKKHVQSFVIHRNEADRNFILSSNDRNLENLIEEPVFCELLYDGTNKLFARRSLKINAMLVKENPFNKSVYYADDKYYALVKGTWITRPQKPSAYYELYGKPEIKKIIRTHKLSLGREQDLIRFLSELDSIDQQSNLPAEE